MEEICLPTRKKNSVSLSTLSLSTLSVSKAEALLSRSQLSLSQKLKLSRSQLSYSLGFNSVSTLSVSTLLLSRFQLSRSQLSQVKKFLSHLPLLNKNFTITLQYLANVYLEIFSFRVFKFCNLVLRLINIVSVF